MRNDYHPFRFGQLAKTSSLRFKRMEEMAVVAAARRSGDPALANREAFARLMMHEAQGMQDAEFADRMRDQAVVNSMRTRWADTGRQVFDTSAMTLPQASFEGSFPELPPDTVPAFYIHFGECANLALGNYDSEFVDGLYISRDSTSSAYEIGVMCGIYSYAAKPSPTWGEILRMQSRAAFGRAEGGVSIAEVHSSLSGDEGVRSDASMSAVLERASLALHKIFGLERLAKTDHDRVAAPAFRH